MRNIFLLFAFLVSLSLSAQQPTPEQIALMMRSDTLQRVFKQQADGGIALAQQHVKAEPKNPFAYLVLSEIYLKAGKQQEAFKALKKGMKHVGKGLTFERRILTNYEFNSYLKTGDTLSAYQSLDEVLKLDSLHGWFNNQYAEISEKQGKIDQARAYHLRGVRGGGFQNRIDLANFEIRQGNYRAAIAQFDTVRLTEPLNKDVVERLPFALIADGQYDRALPLVLDFVGSSNAIYPSLKTIRLLYEYQPEKVIAALHQRHIERPKQTSWLIAEGYIYGSLGRTYESVKCYQTAWEIDPSDRLNQLLAWGYGALAQPDRAIYHLELLPDDEANEYFKAELPRHYFEMGMHEKAVEISNEQIRKSKNPAPLVAQRLVMFTVMHKDLQALTDCEYLLKSDPKNLHLNLSRGRLLYYLGRHEEAKKALEATQLLIFEKILNDGLSNPNFRDVAPSELDFTYFYLGQHEEALATLENRLSDIHGAPELYDAACLHALLGNKDKAMFYLKRAMDLGYLKIYHIKTDRDLESLHDLPEFQKLIDEYHEKVKNGILHNKY